MSSEGNYEKYIIAVDIGGTKISAATITVDGRIVHKLIIPTLQEGPEKGINQIIELVEKVIQRSKIELKCLIGIGVGIPAVLERDTDFVIWGPNLMNWKNIDLSNALRERFNLPVSIEYDGHTAVLGEWWMGSAKNCHSVVNIIIGTGVGAGLIIEGKLIRGFDRLAGAAGWFVFDNCTDPDRDDEKKLGCWEARISGPGIAQRAHKLLETQPKRKSILRSKGSEIVSKDIYEAAQLDDDLALQIINEIGELMGMGIANIVSLINPEVVILGGSVGSNSTLLLPNIEEIIRRYAQPYSAKSVRIVTSKLKSKAGLYGAAYGILLRLKEENEMF